MKRQLALPRGVHAQNCHCPRCRHVRRHPVDRVLARAAGLALAAIATLIAALACRDPMAWGRTGIALAMLLYAGASAAFVRADAAPRPR